MFGENDFLHLIRDFKGLIVEFSTIINSLSSSCFHMTGLELFHLSYGNSKNECIIKFYHCIF